MLAATSSSSYQMSTTLLRSIVKSSCWNRAMLGQFAAKRVRVSTQNKRAAIDSKFPLGAEVGMRILIHEAHQAVAAEIERHMQKFCGFNSGPDEPPRNWNKAKGLAFRPREFLKNLTEC